MCAQRRREEDRTSEQQVPIIIVPVRRVDPRHEAELRTGLSRVQSEVHNFQAYVRAIRVPPTERTAQALEGGRQRLEQTLDRLQLSSIPVLGERDADEIALVRGTITSARRAISEGRIGSAVELLQQGIEQLSALGEISETEIRAVVFGIPVNLVIEGVSQDQAWTAVLDAYEGLLLDVGTPNSARYRNGHRAMRLYVDNAPYFNVDHPGMRRERDTTLNLVSRRGREARARASYTQEQAHEDQQVLSSLERNIANARTQINQWNVNVLGLWDRQLALLISEERNEDTRRRLQELKEQIEAVLSRARAGRELDSEELRTITSRYFLLSGQSPPRTEEERGEMLEATARDLRGTASSVRDGTAQGFREQALIALRSGNTQIAALAVSMG